MTSLIVDTSSEQMILAIAKDGKLVSESISLHGNRLSHSLFTKLDALIEEAQVTRSCLKYIALGLGPGSYTGTRVGAAFAQSLAFALHIPLIGFCSLLAFTPPVSGTFAHLFKSKGNEFYLLKGNHSIKNFNYQLPSNLYSMQETCNLLADTQHVVAAFYAEELPLENKQWHLPSPHLSPLAFYLYQKYLGGEYSFNAQQSLIYLY